MKRSFDFQLWLKPVLTVLLGFLLIFRPDSITSTLALCVGIVLALTGAAKMVSFFTQMKLRKDYSKLAVSIVLLLIGFAIIRSPLSLEKQVVRVIGILLLLEGIRGYTDVTVLRARVSSTALCIAGAVLVLMPVTVARLAVQSDALAAAVRGAIYVKTPDEVLRLLKAQASAFGAVVIAGARDPGLPVMARSLAEKE